MNLQEWVNNSIAVQRQKTFSKSDQLSLGEIILKLEPIVEKQKQRLADGQTEATVVYDFEYLFPNMIDSWRGSYSELALNFTSTGNNMKVTDFYCLLKDAVGKTFTGYKGGEFTMSRQTPVWVANYGNSGNTAVIEIVDNDYQVIIMTGYREY